MKTCIECGCRRAEKNLFIDPRPENSMFSDDRVCLNCLEHVTISAIEGMLYDIEAASNAMVSALPKQDQERAAASVRSIVASLAPRWLP